MAGGGSGLGSRFPWLHPGGGADGAQPWGRSKVPTVFSMDQQASVDEAQDSLSAGLIMPKEGPPGRQMPSVSESM